MTNRETVRNVLEQKGGDVYWVSPGASVYEALQLMSSFDVGAVMVVSDGGLCGVFSERDYARKVVLAGKSSRETSVGEIMSSPPITVELDRSIEDCLHVMTKYRVRHLPVVDGGRLAGVLSIGDLVNWTIERQGEEIQHLNHYITGAYPS